jgi:hypothetical protein
MVCDAVHCGRCSQSFRCTYSFHLHDHVCYPLFAGYLLFFTLKPGKKRQYLLRNFAYCLVCFIVYKEYTNLLKFLSLIFCCDWNTEVPLKKYLWKKIEFNKIKCSRHHTVSNRVTNRAEEPVALIRVMYRSQLIGNHLRNTRPRCHSPDNHNLNFHWRENLITQHKKVVNYLFFFQTNYLIWLHYNLGYIA